MALGYVTALRNAMMLALSNRAATGPANAIIRVYDGVRPVTGGTITNLLAEVTLSSTPFQAPVNGVLTANAISPDLSTQATGVATWYRLFDGNVAAVLDGSVGLSGSGADLIVDDTSIVAGQEFRVSSYTITEGNP